MEQAHDFAGMHWSYQMLEALTAPAMHGIHQIFSTTEHKIHVEVKAMSPAHSSMSSSITGEMHGQHPKP